MRVLHLLFCLFVVTCFFFFGISVADKEYLSENVVCICILADDAETIVNIQNFLAKVQATDAENLCLQLNDQGIFSCLSSQGQYIDATYDGRMYFPSGLYITINIDLSESDKITSLYFKQVGYISNRFCCPESEFATSMQKYYINFLSLLGKLEKRFITLKSAL